MNRQIMPHKNSTSPTPIDLSETEAKKLFQKAHQNFQQKTSNITDRITAIEQLIEKIRLNQENIIEHICHETGKCRTDALVSEILGVLDNLEWLHKNAQKLLREKKVSTPITLLGKKSFIRHEPLGTVLIIAPWNYPFHIGMTSIAAAFICGNSIVFKPSEITPLEGLFESLFECSPLLQEHIFITYGTGLTAQRLIEQKPEKVFFTGSAKTGKKILTQCANHLIPVDLELGGKDQAIVFDDVNLKRAVKGILWGALTNAGQSCSSVERVYVQNTIYDAFIELAQQEIHKLILNNGDTGNADIGAITADFQIDIIHNQVIDAREKGANILTGGTAIDPHTKFYLPTLITNTQDSMDILNQETFGPVIPIIPFDTEEAVIKASNQSRFGLSASVWSEDLKRAKAVAQSLECGAVSINNVMLTEGNPALPFGGCKESGYGRQKGEQGLLGFTRSKSILIDKNSAHIEPNWYPYTQKKYQLFESLIHALFQKGPFKLIKAARIGMKLDKESQLERNKRS